MAFGSAQAEGIPARPFLAYHASWYELQARSGAETTLSRLPGYIDIVVLAFAKPDLSYRGGLDTSATGLEYRFPGSTLKQAVALLKQRHPATRVILGVGGAAYRNWDRLDEAAIGRLVADFGLDGVDVDFEPGNPACDLLAGRMVCRSDKEWIDYVGRLRRALPRPLVLTVPGWSVGAYGEGEFQDARPPSYWTGSMLGLLRSSTVADIDLLSLAAYDAGPSFDPALAFRAYRTYWRGPFALGLIVMPSLQGDPRRTLDETRAMLQALPADAKTGAMLYALQETPPGVIGPDNPSAAMLARTICTALGKRGCQETVP